MAAFALETIQKSIPYLLAFPSRHSWVDYDQEADVLYLNFEKPEPASDSEMTGEDVIIRRQGEKVIGLTFLNASKRK